MNLRIWTALWLGWVPAVLAAEVPRQPPDVLPPAATRLLATSLDAAARHDRHVWRDTPPFTPGDLVNAYVEIPKGERRKFEFDMRANARKVDRVVPEAVGGYPVNYGFVPQTISYDGDPFDALILGPPLTGGEVVRGAIVGLMLMEDHKGLDSKVVLSPISSDGRPAHALDDKERQRLAHYFSTYRKHDPDTFSNVPGWGSAVDGRTHVEVAHAFFRRCREHAGRACRIGR